MKSKAGNDHAKIVTKPSRTINKTVDDLILR